MQSPSKHSPGKAGHRGGLAHSPAVARRLLHPTTTQQQQLAAAAAAANNSRPQLALSAALADGVSIPFHNRQQPQPPVQLRSPRLAADDDAQESEVSERVVRGGRQRRRRGRAHHSCVQHCRSLHCCSGMLLRPPLQLQRMRDALGDACVVDLVRVCGGCSNCVLSRPRIPH
jgi:hypothetical protein